MVRKMLAAFNGAAELTRFPLEYGALCTWWPWLSRIAPRGKGQPVLVLPGFACADTMTAPLRERLRAQGYDVYGWNGGVNTGFNPTTAAHLVARLREIYDASGGQKVRLIGHSLGGVFARELARDFPDMVDRVITLGSPFGMKEEEAPAMLLKMYKIFNPTGDADELSDHDLYRRRLTPPRVPVTSIYSTTDGVVPWRACLNPQTARSENIAVPSSHLGIIYHPMAVSALLDRLAVSKKGWQPFHAGAYALFYAFTSSACKNDLPDNPAWKRHAQARKLFPKAG